MMVVDTEEKELVYLLVFSIPRVFRTAGSPDDLNYILTHIKQSVLHRGLAKASQRLLVNILAPLGAFKSGYLDTEELQDQVLKLTGLEYPPSNNKLVSRLSDLKEVAVELYEYSRERGDCNQVRSNNTKGGQVHHRLVYTRDSLLRARSSQGSCQHVTSFHKDVYHCRCKRSSIPWLSSLRQIAHSFEAKPPPMTFNKTTERAASMESSASTPQPPSDPMPSDQQAHDSTTSDPTPHMPPYPTPFVGGSDKEQEIIDPNPPTPSSGLTPPFTPVSQYERVLDSDHSFVTPLTSVPVTPPTSTPPLQGSSSPKASPSPCSPSSPSMSLSTCRIRLPMCSPPNAVASATPIAVSTVSSTSAPLNPEVSPSNLVWDIAPYPQDCSTSKSLPKAPPTLVSSSPNLSHLNEYYPQDEYLSEAPPTSISVPKAPLTPSSESNALPTPVSVPKAPPTSLSESNPPPTPVSVPKAPPTSVSMPPTSFSELNAPPVPVSVPNAPPTSISESNTPPTPISVPKAPPTVMADTSSMIMTLPAKAKVPSTSKSPIILPSKFDSPPRSTPKISPPSIKLHSSATPYPSKPPLLGAAPSMHEKTKIHPPPSSFNFGQCLLPNPVFNFSPTHCPLPKQAPSPQSRPRPLIEVPSPQFARPRPLIEAPSPQFARPRPLIGSSESFGPPRRSNTCSPVHVGACHVRPHPLDGHRTRTRTGEAVYPVPAPVPVTGFDMVPPPHPCLSFPLCPPQRLPQTLPLDPPPPPPPLTSDLAGLMQTSGGGAAAQHVLMSMRSVVECEQLGRGGMNAANDEETAQILCLWEVVMAVPSEEWTPSDLGCVQEHLQRAVELGGLTGEASVAAGKMIAALGKYPFVNSNLNFFHSKKGRSDLFLSVDCPSVVVAKVLSLSILYLSRAAGVRKKAKQKYSRTQLMALCVPHPPMPKFPALAWMMGIVRQD